MLLSKFTVCNCKKWRYIKKQEARGLLSKFGTKTPLGKMPTLDDVLL